MSLLDWLFPPRCILCHRFLIRGGEAMICDPCGLRLLRQQPMVRRDTAFSICVSPLRYADDVRRSICRYKFEDRRFYAKIYGKWLAACIREHLSGEFDTMTWVPVSSKRRRSRGFDQTFLLCREAASALGMQPVRCLKKMHDNPAQSTLSSAQLRKGNVSGVYCVPDPALVRGKRILLVDDIITTGATLHECAKMLRASGAADVKCATLAATE